MSLTKDHVRQLQDFLSRADFSKGAVTIDLDGTALLEVDDKLIISDSVGKGIKKILDIGRPVLINSLRSPLNIVKYVARDWIAISGERIPVILLNGSMLGHIDMTHGGPEFNPEASFPMSEHEIRTFVNGIQELISSDRSNLFIMYYPRAWQKGEIIWTPHPGRVEELRATFVRSASNVYSSSVTELADRMITDQSCMIFLSAKYSHDELKSYQHRNPEDFFTSEHVNKTTGQEYMSKLLNVALHDSFGAGDTRMDTFLSIVGLAVRVGDPERVLCPYSGVRETITVPGPHELGELIIELARYCEKVRSNIHS